jgi:hypothetical protein
MVQVMVVVIVVTFAVTRINQVVAVALNHVMTVEVMIEVVLITVIVSLVLNVAVVFNRVMAQASAVTVAAVMKAVATVNQHRVNQMVTLADLSSTAQKDLLAIVHVALVIAMLVAIAQTVTATVASVQVVVAQVATVALVTVLVHLLVRLTVVLVMQLLSAKNLSHVMAQAHHVAKVTVIAVVTAQRQIVAITAY